MNDKPKVVVRSVEPGEELLRGGKWGDGSTYRVLVRGRVGVKEIDALISELESAKQFLPKNSDDEVATSNEP